MGRVTADPQLKTTPTGQSVATLSVATNRTWTNKNGQKQEDAQFHNIVVWGRQAEVVGQFLRKGSLVFVEGRLQTRSWQDSQGQTRRVTEIVSERVQLGPRSSNPGQGGGSYGGGNFTAPNGFSQSTPKNQGVDETPISEVLPEINVDEEDIKPEDLPF